MLFTVLVESDSNLLLIAIARIFLARNAVIVIVCASIAYGITDIDLPPANRTLTLTKNITGGLPPFQVPSFSYDVPGENRTVYFGEIISHLGSGLIVIPLIGFLESIAIAKAFGKL